MRDPERSPPGPLPEVIHSVAMSTRRRDRAGQGRSSTARVQAADGSWWTVHASLADGAGAPDGPQVDEPRGTGPQAAEPQSTGPAGWEQTVTVQPAGGGELTGILMRSLRLSPGERAVCELLLAGLPTKAIATEMSLSPHTVEDRLKAIFAKGEVTSRQELVARLNPAAVPR
jgi:DNA-binding CsgD family transcriptional regulator